MIPLNYRCKFAKKNLDYDLFDDMGWNRTGNQKMSFNIRRTRCEYS